MQTDFLEKNQLKELKIKIKDFDLYSFRLFRRKFARYKKVEFQLKAGDIMNEIKIRDEFIKLGQAMKLAGLVDEGSDAKFVIQNGEVKVNGETEYQRGKKLHPGDTFEYKGQTVTVASR